MKVWRLDLEVQSGSGFGDGVAVRVPGYSAGAAGNDIVGDLSFVFVAPG